MQGDQHSSADQRNRKNSISQVPSREKQDKFKKIHTKWEGDRRKTPSIRSTAKGRR